MAPAPSINLSGWLSERVDPGELPTGIRREPLLPATAKRPLAADASALSSLIPLMSSAPYHPDPAAEHVNAGHQGAVMPHNGRIRRLLPLLVASAFLADQNQ